MTTMTSPISVRWHSPVFGSLFSSYLCCHTTCTTWSADSAPEVCVLSGPRGSVLHISFRGDFLNRYSPSSFGEKKKKKERENKLRHTIHEIMHRNFTHKIYEFSMFFISHIATLTPSVIQNQHCVSYQICCVLTFCFGMSRLSVFLPKIPKEISWLGTHSHISSLHRLPPFLNLPLHWTDGRDSAQDGDSIFLREGNGVTWFWLSLDWLIETFAPIPPQQWQFHFSDFYSIFVTQRRALEG